MKVLIFLGIFLSFLLFLIHFHFVGFGVYGDGVGYYSYTHALFFHGNLDFHSEFKYYSNFTNHGQQLNRIFWDLSPTATGYLPNHWSIGPGILWLPFMALGDSIAKYLDLFGIHYALDGFSAPYEVAVGFGNIVYGILGIYFLYKFLRHYFKAKICLLSAISIFLGTNLLYYIAIEPNLSHAVSFFAVSLFLYLWKNTCKDNSLQNFALLGIVGGITSMIRLYDIVLITVPLASLTIMYLKVRTRSKKKDLSANALVLMLFWFIAYFPQLMAQKIIYGYFWYQPYLYEGNAGGFPFFHNFLFATLFSIKRGLFFWSPILLLALVGWAVGIRRYWQIFLIFLLLFVTQWQVIGRWNAALSAGFGARMYISSLPLFAVGLAIFFDKLKNMKVAMIIVSFFVIWNALLLNQFFMDKRLLEGELSLPQIMAGQISNMAKIPQKINALSTK